VAAIQQADRILQVLGSHGGFAQLNDIVRKTGIPKSSAHRVVNELVRTGMVEQGDGPRYRIGMRIVELASSRINDMDVVQKFVQVCGSWDRLTEDSIVLSVLDGDDVIYVACRNGSRPVGVHYRIGMRLPAHTTASGKAMLAWRARSSARRAEDPEYQQIRERGYSIDDEGTAPGMTCFGAPVQSTDGTVTCAVAISIVKASVRESDYEMFAREVKLLARALA
jgi:DNA-binding IclR family transcriptional regulator